MIRTAFPLSALLLLAPALAQEPGQALPFRDVAVVFHVHTFRSHDSDGADERVARAAADRSIAAVCLSDHPAPGVPETQPDGLFPPLSPRERAALGEAEGRVREPPQGVLFVPGAETHNLLAFGIHRPVAGETTAEAAADVLLQGGLPILCHAEEVEDWDIPGIVGVEIYNLHADVREEDPADLALGLARVAGSSSRLFAAFLDRPDVVLARWDALLERRPLVGIAGNDAHENVRAGPLLLDPYRRSLGFVRTHLLVPPSDAPLARADIEEALLSRRSYVAFDAFDDATGFRFEARTPGGLAEPQGAEVPYEPGLALAIELPARGTIRLLRGGVPVASETGRSLRYAVPSPGVYRVEVEIRWRARSWPWIFSNPIFVR